MPIADLPQVAAEDAIRLFGHLCEMLTQRHGYVDAPQKANGHDRGAGAGFNADEVLASMQPTESSVEETQRRVILSRLQHGAHPDDILQEMVDATMQVAGRGLRIRGNRNRYQYK